MKKYIFIIALTVVLLLIADADLIAQCPMCKAGVESNAKEGAKNLPGALNFGILYLFALPYLMIGGVAFIWYRSYRRRKRRAEAELSENPES